MRIDFMGTPDFSVPALKALVEAGHDVAAVVTQPDKPKGRGKEMQMTPVKIQALEYKIPVYQPVKVRDESFVKVLREMEADVFVVIAFGQILPKSVLDLPRLGCVNIHASLLPKYRGAAPIQWCVIDGEKETGITTMMMDVGLDTGDMLESAVSIERLIRGLNPWPSAYTMWNGKTIKIWSADVLGKDEEEGIAHSVPSLDSAPRGTVVCSGKRSLVVKTGEGLLSIKELQMEGKKVMDVDAVLRGYTVPDGDILSRKTE